MIQFANPLSSDYYGIKTPSTPVSSLLSSNGAVVSSSPARDQFTQNVSTLNQKLTTLGNSGSTTSGLSSAPANINLSTPKTTPVPTPVNTTPVKTTPVSTSTSGTPTAPPPITFKSSNPAFQAIIDQANQLLVSAAAKGAIAPEAQNSINQINNYEATKTQALAEAHDAATKKDAPKLNEAMANVDAAETGQKDAITKLMEEMKTTRADYLSSLAPTEGEIDLRKQIQSLRAGRQLLPLELRKEGISAAGIEGRQVEDERVRAIQEQNLLSDLGLQQEARLAKSAGLEKGLSFIGQDIELQMKIEDRINENKQKVLDEARTLRNDGLSALKDIVTEFQGLAYTDLDPQTQSEVLDMAKKFGISANLLSAAMQNAKEQEVYDRSVQKKAGAGGGVSGGTLSGITQSVISNPTLFNDLTPTVRGQVIAELQAGGYDTTNLGVKGLSDAAIGQVAQSQKALSDLGELKTILAGNTQYLGPISGLAALNPWSKARQVQADVDRVKQTVGKALEGGVLRKEDEDKYKKILSTLLDTPETAAYKIDALISSIQRDIENYKSLQQQSGKSLDVKASLSKTGATASVEDLRAKYNY